MVKNREIIQTLLHKIIITEDGSHTIYVPELKEHYHSVHGAIQESEHVYIKNGFDQCNSNPLNILEVGFGTGLNALLTALHNLNNSRKVFYTAFEKYPVDTKIIDSLNYHSFFGSQGEEIFKKIHMANWEEMNRIYSDFFLRKVKGDFVKDDIPDRYNLIYFDAFAPDKQPEIWTLDVFRKVAEASDKDTVFVTYSAKGEVRRNLRTCGFKVSIVPGPPGKRHIIRAVKT